MKTQSNDLRVSIIEKYGSIKRFADLAQMNYSKVYNCVIGKNKISHAEMEEIIKKHLEKMRDVEVTSELIKNVRQFIYDNYKNHSEFCRIHNIPYTWLSLFLNGRIRFVNKRIKSIENMLNEK